ncbi:hypothetical protein ABTE40_20190, partial [Acinetobacter baumannii]
VPRTNQAWSVEAVEFFAELFALGVSCRLRSPEGKTPAELHQQYGLASVLSSTPATADLALNDAEIQTMPAIAELSSTLDTSTATTEAQETMA